MSKYIDNLVSLSVGIRTPSEKTENMMGPRLSTHKAIAPGAEQLAVYSEHWSFRMSALVSHASNINTSTQR